LSDTPAQAAQTVSSLFGEGRADISEKEIHIRVPAKSIAIFSLS
jgi:hypothetical protein